MQYKITTPPPPSLPNNSISFGAQSHIFPPSDLHVKQFADQLRQIEDLLNNKPPSLQSICLLNCADVGTVRQATADAALAQQIRDRMLKYIRVVEIAHRLQQIQHEQWEQEVLPSFNTQPRSNNNQYPTQTVMQTKQMSTSTYMHRSINQDSEQQIKQVQQPHAQNQQGVHITPRPINIDININNVSRSPKNNKDLSISHYEYLDNKGKSAKAKPNQRTNNTNTNYQTRNSNLSYKQKQPSNSNLQRSASQTSNSKYFHKIQLKSVTKVNNDKHHTSTIKNESEVQNIIPAKPKTIATIKSNNLNKTSMSVNTSQNRTSSMKKQQRSKQKEKEKEKKRSKMSEKQMGRQFVVEEQKEVKKTRDSVNVKRYTISQRDSKIQPQQPARTQAGFNSTTSRESRISAGLRAGKTNQISETSKNKLQSTLSKSRYAPVQPSSSPRCSRIRNSSPHDPSISPRCAKYHTDQTQKLFSPSRRQNTTHVQYSPNRHIDQCLKQDRERLEEILCEGEPATNGKIVQETVQKSSQFLMMLRMMSEQSQQ